MSRKKLADEHIRCLYSRLKEVAYSRPDLAQRYVQHIRRIAMKLRYHLPRPVKRSFCKHCYVAFAPGKNCRIRTRDQKLIYYCFNCKKHSRIPLKK